MAYDQAEVLHLSKSSSDRIPIQLSLSLKHSPRARLFRFLEAWTRDPMCKEVAIEAWRSADCRDRVALIMYKIHSTTIAIRNRNKNTFGFCQSEMLDPEEKIQWL